MGNPYTSQSISGYNSSPPPDDGTNSSANEITWAKHKSKLADPIKTLSEAIDTATLAAFAKILGAGVTSTVTAYTVLTEDQGKLIDVTAGVTITTPAAATEGVPFVFAVKNDHSAAITIDGNGSETIDGSATISLPAGSTVIISTDGSNWFTLNEYGDTGQYNVGSDAGEIAVNEQDWTAIASAATVNIGAAATGRVNITGTTTITAFDTVTAGLTREVRFDGALTLTHNGTSLILPGGANITTASGDVAKFVSEGSGNWRCVKYMKASGAAVVSSGGRQWLYGATVSTGQATVDIADTDIDWTAYDIYEVDVSNLTVDTDDVEIYLRVYDTTLAAWQSDAADYKYVGSHVSGTSITGFRSSGAAQIALTGNVSATRQFGNAANETFGGKFYIQRPADTSEYAQIIFDVGWDEAAGSQMGLGSGRGKYIGALNAISGFRLVASSGNIDGCNIDVWGIKTS